LPLVASYSSASSLPSAVWNAFKTHEINSNIMYPHAIKSLKQPHSTKSKQHWITLAFKHSRDASYEIDIVLSCTSWELGDYPIFMFTTKPFSSLSIHWLQPRLQLIIQELVRLVPLERIYSVFAPAPITKLFVRTMQSLTGLVPVQTPYYAASLSFCNRQTFRDRRQTGDSHVLRPAQEIDIAKVAALCMGFAETSDPFALDDQGAVREATELIKNGLLWVHQLDDSTSSDICSIVATKRKSENVTAITKVYTNPLYRSRGCAERLVRRVCQHALLKERKDSVVLFVAHDNLAAAKVYDRVGFQGLCGKPRVEGVDPWLEVGFQDTNLGHW